jgi:hypothetical protein
LLTTRPQITWESYFFYFFDISIIFFKLKRRSTGGVHLVKTSKLKNVSSGAPWGGAPLLDKTTNAAPTPGAPLLRLKKKI